MSHPDPTREYECENCGGEEYHACECEQEITAEQCKQYQGYCDDNCGKKYCK